MADYTKHSDSEQPEAAKSLPLFSSTTSAGGSLTLESLNKFIEHFDSPEYKQAEHERLTREAESKVMLNKAWNRKLITDEEYYYCLVHMNDGYIILSSTMHKRLKPKFAQLEAEDAVSTADNPPTAADDDSLRHAPEAPIKRKGE